MIRETFIQIAPLELGCNDPGERIQSFSKNHFGRRLQLMPGAGRVSAQMADAG
jgi:hypothetical protein